MYYHVLPNKRGNLSIAMIVYLSVARGPVERDDCGSAVWQTPVVDKDSTTVVQVAMRSALLFQISSVTRILDNFSTNGNLLLQRVWRVP